MCIPSCSGLNWRLKTRDTENRHTSYIAEYWYDMYLKDRRPLLLNQNPFMAFQLDPRKPSQVGGGGGGT